MSRTCTSCGALLADDAVRCDLCGMEVGEVPAEPDAGQAASEAGSEADATPTDADAVQDEPAAGDGVFCNQCGWENPVGARFCSSCGAALQQVSRAASSRPAVTPPPPPPKSGPADTAGQPDESNVGRRLGMIFGAALLVIVAFFLIDAVSSGGSSSAPPSGGSAAGTQAPAAAVTTDTPLPADIEDQLAAIHDQASGLEGEARIAKLREGVSLLLTVGRFDRAGEEQEAIAEATGTEEDWGLVGNHYYDWMDQQFGPERVTFAKKAIAAYRKALEINPDNLDIRTDMAVAYMSDPDNPMLAIQENAAVLEQDSLHVQANFNRGIMLLQINRVDQALAQFRKVQRIVDDPEAPISQLAEQAILSIEQGGMGPAN